jgi:hypothetical protein
MNRGAALGPREPTRRAELQELQDDFDETGTMPFHRACELGREFPNRRCAARLHAHARRKLDPIQFGIMQIEHREGLGSGIASSDPCKLNIYRVRAVGKDHRGDIERLPCLRPQHLQRIHRPAVAAETDNFPVRTGNRGARGDRDALPDRAARQRKMIVLLDIGCKSMNAAACRCAFVGNNGAARKIMGDDLSGRQRIERSGRNIGLALYTDVQRLLGCL